MTIIVCIKEVPASGDVRIDPKSGNLLRGSTEGVMNPYDKNALEAALQLKEKTGDRVVALSMGPPQFAETLREALAMGCDDAILLSSRAFAGADTLATGYVLAKAVEKIGAVRVILCGRHAVDADTGQVGPIVADCLGLPQATFAGRLELLESGRALVTRLLDTSEETVSVALPAVITVTDQLNTPRYVDPRRVLMAAARDISVWNETDLECDPGKIGAQGSPTKVTKVFSPLKAARIAAMISGGADEAAGQICDLLGRKKIL